MRSARDEHDWDLIEQAFPQATARFGFLCGCGAAALAAYPSAREAIRAARSHPEEPGTRVRAA